MTRGTISCLVTVAMMHGSLTTGLSFSNRRKFVHAFIGAVAGWKTVEPATAACLPGDLDPSCIGVYKVPLDDCISDMVSTKEALQRFAPDVNFVPLMASPRTTRAALEALQTQRLAVDDITAVVAAGRLEEAGIEVLNLLPRLTLSGRVLVQAAVAGPVSDTNELRRQQLTVLLQTAEVAWNEVDILMGQGLRGRLGVSAVAQLLILDELREATKALDDFIGVVTQVTKL